MRGPYRVTKVLPHGRYELQRLAGSYGKTTQAAAEYIMPWRGEWTPEACAAYFESADQSEEEPTPASVDMPQEVDALPLIPETVSAETQSAGMAIDEVQPSTSRGTQILSRTKPTAEPSMPLLDTDMDS
ncbi:uncharacterized protein LOC126381573 [Pectinophora gossypiella]|uniref:uncharacterized protein LOC126381573 n=1 Tax=Pectinophora gossypiella TaxID=13191 RepID=UPI00214EA0A3|nr:uncharacterized protein LOC126381573 [Pectinophora gossypiella]